MQRNKFPQHVAIIMDGNGRWAAERKMPRSFGHKAGVQATERLIHAALKHQVAILTLFAFGCDNWGRQHQEVDAILQLLYYALTQKIDLLKQNHVALRVIGDWRTFDHKLRQKIEYTQHETAHCNKLLLNIAINYSGRWDIIQAAQSLARRAQQGLLKPNDIDEKCFEQQLSLQGCPDPDLLIRTGYEQRLSNFLLWHLSYTEFYFSDVYWPDFSEQHFLMALNEFKKRQRRFGLECHQKGENH